MSTRTPWLTLLFLSIASGLFACALQRDQNATAAGIAQWTLHPNPVVSDGNSAAEYEVIVVKANGEVWKGAQLTVEASDAHVLVQQPQRTDEQGAASATVRCTAPGVYTLEARVQEAEMWFSLAGAATLTCLSAEDAIGANPEAFPTVALTALHVNAAADLSAPVPLTLAVTDALGRPLANQLVTLTTLRAGDQVMPATGVTDAYGKIQAFLTATTLGTATVMARSGTVADSVTVQFVAYAPHMMVSTFVARPGDAVPNVDNGQILDLTVRDVDGRLVPYAAVLFSSDKATDQLTPQSALTDVDGRLSVALTGGQPGNRNVYAATHTGSLTTAVTLATGAPSSAASYLHISPNVLIADGAATSTLTAVINDAHGNPLPDYTVTFASDGASNTLLSAMGTTNPSGIAASTLASTKAESKTVTAQTSGLVLQATAMFLAGAPNETMSALTIAPTTRLADGYEAVLAAAQINDAFGNPVAGLPASVAVSGADTISVPSSGVTSAAGAFSSQITTTTIQNQTVTLNAGPYHLATNVNFTLGPPKAATSSFTASPSSGLSSDGSAVSALTITLRDSGSHILANHPLTLMSSAPGRLLSPASLSTDATGTAYATVRSTLSGTSFIRAVTGGDLLSTSVCFMADSPVCATDLLLPIRPRNNKTSGSVRIHQADLNGDGIPDLLSTGLGYINIGLGLGDGTFYQASSGGPPGTLLSSISYNNTDGIVVADFDEDGHPDIVAAMNNNTVILLHGGGDGNFIQTQVLPAFGPTIDLCFADFNEDGRNDLAVVAAKDGSGASAVNLTILTATGSGNFITQASYSINGTPTRCIAADINNDSNPDLVIKTANTVQIMLGYGNGTFAPATTVTSRVTTDYAVGDIDNDGNLDLVIAGSSPSTGLFTILGHGDGTFSAVKDFAQSSIANSYSLSLYDADHDGFLDACSITNGNFVILRNDQSGNFTTTIASTPIWDQSSSASVGDFNGDGNMDFLYSNGGTASIFPVLNRGNFQYEPFAHLNRAYFFLVKADINNDGRMDLIGLSSGNQFTTILQNSNGTFSEQDTITSAAPLALGVGDLNGDGYIDVLASYTSQGKNQVFVGAGDGTFVAGSTFNASFKSSSTNSPVVFEDLNHDGALDIVGLSGNSNALSTFINTGNGNFTLFSSLILPTLPQSFNLADVNSDGLLDLIVGLTQSRRINIYTGMGDGTFSSTPIVTLTNGPWINIGDFNGDGIIDILGHRGGSSGSSYATYLGLGDGQFAPSQPTGLTTLYFDDTIPAVADIDGDGFVDIIGLSKSLGFRLARGKGDGTFLPAVTYSSGSLSGVVIDDFNGDDRQDLVFHNGVGKSMIAFSSGCD